MKKTYLIILLCFIFTHGWAANIDKATFEKMVDYVNGKICLYYISTLTAENDKANYGKLTPELAKHTIDKPLSYLELSTLLEKYNFEATKTKLLDKINERKNKFNANLSNSELIGQVLDNSDLLSLKELCDTGSKNLKSLLLQTYKEPVPEKSLEKEPINKGITQTIHKNIGNVSQEKPSFWAFTISIWTLIFSVIVTMILCCIVFIIMNKRTNRRASVFEVRHKTNRLREELEEAKQRINALEIAITKLQQQPQQNHQPTFPVTNRSESSRSTQPSKIVQTPSAPINEVLYMSTPNLDGSFSHNASRKDYLKTSSFYRFEINTNNKSLATFNFIDETWNVETAVSQPQSYLDPVCEADNAHNKNAKRIVTVSKGKAEKEGNTWIVKTKAHIKYE